MIFTKKFSWSEKRKSGLLWNHVECSANTYEEAEARVTALAVWYGWKPKPWWSPRRWFFGPSLDIRQALLWFHTNYPQDKK